MPSFSSVSLQRWLLPPVAAALALALQMGGDNALAQQTPAPQAGPGARPETLNLTPAQRQQLFESRRALEKKSHAGRIAILQEADRCITAATDAQGYRQCEQKEQQARQELRTNLRTELQAMRSQFGLPAKPHKP
jgi:hypothetical protein